MENAVEILREYFHTLILHILFSPFLYHFYIFISFPPFSVKT
jgi:hypothetical protein